MTVHHDPASALPGLEASAAAQQAAVAVAAVQRSLGQWLLQVSSWAHVLEQAAFCDTFCDNGKAVFAQAQLLELHNVWVLLQRDVLQDVCFQVRCQCW